MNSHQRMLPQQYCLRWKYHHNNLQVMFSQLLERESFCDVTLACEGRTLRAHKVVLSACSTYFDAIFSQYEEKNPIVILKDVKFTDIRALVEFMYRGEINIDHSHLASLLKAAEDLRIKGLAEVSWRSDAHATQSLEENVRNSNHNVYPMDSVNENEVEPPLKRRRGRPPMDASTPIFNPKVTSISGAVGTEAAFTEGPAASDAENDLSAWDESENEVLNSEPPPETSTAPPVSAHQSYSTLLSHLAKGTPTLTQEPFPETEEKEKPKPPPYPEGTTTATAADAAATTTATSPTITSQIAEQYRDVLKLNAASTTTATTPTITSQIAEQYRDALKLNAASTTTSTIPTTTITNEIAAQYRDVVKLNDYLTTGRRQQFWEEPFTKRIMDAIKSKELEMKTGAELLGVSYGTLYGRYRDAYGCLKHPYRVRDFWSESGPADVLSKVQRKEITLFRAAEMLNVTVTTLANYLSTLRQYEGEESLDESRDQDDSFGEAYKASIKRKFSTSALENNPDITIVKQEPSASIMHHDQVDIDTMSSSIATNNAHHSDLDNPDGHTTANGMDDQAGE